MSPAGGTDASSCAGAASVRKLNVYTDDQENAHAQTTTFSQDIDATSYTKLRLGTDLARPENASVLPGALGQLAHREPLRALPLRKDPADQHCASAQTLALRQHAEGAPLLALPQCRTQAGQRPRLKHPGNLNLTRKLGAPARKPARAPGRAAEPHLSTDAMEASQAADAPNMSKGMGGPGQESQPSGTLKGAAGTVEKSLQMRHLAGAPSSIAGEPDMSKRPEMYSQQSRPSARGAGDSAGPPARSKMTEMFGQQSRPSSGEVELTGRPPLGTSSRPNQEQQPAHHTSAGRIVDSTSAVSPALMCQHHAY